MTKNKFLLIMFVLLSFSLAFADSAQDLIIQKLNHVLLNLAPQDSSYQAVTLRLADLYSERARQNSLEELNEGCTNCTSGKSDRLEAIRLYRVALKNLKEEEAYKVNLQIAHLLSLVGQPLESQKTYLQLLSKENNPKSRSETLAALGELNFKQRNFKDAIGFYKKALDISELQNRGYVLYRTSWSYFNLGEKEKALSTTIEILNDPKNLIRNFSGQSGNVDQEFKEEVAKDMVTFMSQAGEGSISFATLKKLTPEKSLTANTYYLASELERLGRKNKAIEIWNQYKQIETKPDLRMESSIHLAQLHYDDNARAKSLEEYQEALVLWPQVQVDERRTKELKNRIKNYLATWTSAEKTKPSDDLMKAYGFYLSVFPKEEDVLLTAAGLEKERKNWTAANVFYQNLFDRAQNSESKEKALLGQLEIAEMSKDADLRLKTYDSYLSYFPNGKKSFDVQYQKAYLVYEKAQYEAASGLFLNLALASGSSKEVKALQNKAADLALDSLVLAKLESKLDDYSSQLIKKFPSRAEEFQAVARRAQLNILAEQINSSQDSEKAWSILAAINISGATEKEKLAFYKNKLILAERLKKLEEVRSAADQILTLHPNKEDQFFALKLKSWSCEMVLDFNCAFEAAAKSPYTKEDEALRLGVLADLAGLPSQKYFDFYLNKSKDERKNAILAAKLITKSKNPDKDYIKYKSHLASQPDINEEILLRIYALQKNPQWIRTQWNKSPVSSAGQRLNRNLFLVQLNALAAQTNKFELQTKTDALLKKSLKARIKWVGQLEALANKSIESKDWSSQVIALETLKKELDRLYQEVLSLPMPEGLGQQQQQEYMQLLSQTAAPYKTKSQDIKLKLDEFWKGATAQPALEQVWLKDIVNFENENLAKVAPESLKSLFASKESNEKPAALPSIAELQQARDDVSKAPLVVEPLKKLASLEEKVGRTDMADYLKTRIMDLEQPKVSK